MSNKSLLTIIALALVYACAEKPKETLKPEKTTKPKYVADWDSLMPHKTPDWFQDAKFGIFIHWGLYSIPAYTTRKNAEWYPHWMYQEGQDSKTYHEKNYGKVPEFGYKDFVPMFKAEKWNPEAWADLFERSGAKVVVPVAEHHDGFAMWDSELTEWDAMDKGPKRDIIGELEKPVRTRGMKYVPSYHRERHFSYFKEGGWGVEEGKPPYPGILEEMEQMPESAELYGPFELNDAFMEDYKARWDELCQKYRPDMMWFDDIPIFYSEPNKQHPEMLKYKELLKNMVTEYLNKQEEWGKDLVVNNKGRIEANFPDGFGLREYDYMEVDKINERNWISSRGMAKSYGLNQFEEPDGYPSVDFFVDYLIDITSKNGFFLLNIGPNPDGTISQGQTSRLEGIGEWLQLNGDAIYETRPWNIYGKDNVRFATKGKDLYIFHLDQIQNAVSVDASDINLSAGTSIELVHNGEKVEWEQYEGKLEIILPANYAEGLTEAQKSAYAFKVIDGVK